MNSETGVTTIAVAFFVGASLSQFFGSVSRDLITPIIAGLFPGAQQSLEKITVQVGPVKLSIGDVIGSFINLMIAFLVVSLTLPLIKTYAPVGGRR